jgi:anti-sigma B factor antagonist
MHAREHQVHSGHAANAAESELPMAAFIREANEGSEILHVLGEVDLANADELEAGIHALCSAAVALVVLDLTGCTYIDSTGLRIVAKAHATNARRLRVVVPSQGQIFRIFQMTGLDNQLGILSTVEESLA